MTTWNINTPRQPGRPSAWISGLGLAGALWWVGMSVPGLPLVPAALTSGVLAAFLGAGHPGWRGWLSAMLTASTAALATCILGEAVLHAALVKFWPALHYPLPQTPTEGREALKAWMTRNGGQLYSPLTGYPYLLTFCGPLYYFVAGAFSTLPVPSLLAARLVSAVAFAILLVCLFSLVRRASGSLLAALLAVAALFSHEAMLPASLAGPDMTAWALLFLAVTLLMRKGKPSAGPFQYGPPPLSTLAAVAPAVLLSLALFTQQNIWPFAAACLLAAPALRGWRFALALVTFTVLLVLGGTVAAQMLTHGEFLKQALLFPTALADPGARDSSRFGWDVLRTFWRHEYGLILLWAFGAVWNLLDRKFWLPDFAVLAFVPFLLFVAPADGVRHPAFLPVVIFMCCGVGLFLGRLTEFSPALPLAAVLLLSTPTPNLRAGLEDVAVRSARAALDKAVLLEELNASPGPILCDTESAVSALGNPAFLRLRLYDAQPLTSAAGTGRWNPATSTLLADVATRAFPLAVSSRDLQPGALEALKSLFYQPTGELAALRFEKPLSSPGIAALRTFDAHPQGGEALHVSLASVDNLLVADGWLAVEKPGQTGTAVFRVEGTSLPGAITAMVWPRLNRSNPESEWAFSAGDRVLASARYDEGLGWTPIWEGPLRLEWKTAATGSELTLLLRGEAQLWLNAEHPMAFSAQSSPPQVDTPRATDATDTTDAADGPTPAPESQEQQQ